MPKYFLFDCDGVILDSMHIKTLGYREIFSDQPTELIERFIDFHLRNGGLPRYNKIRYFYNELRGEPISERDVDRLAAQYAAVMRREMHNPALIIPEVVDFIRKHQGSCTFHVVSATEEQELCDELTVLGLASLFCSIHGSPALKEENVEKILTTYGYAPPDTVFVGDSINDLAAAQAFCLPFWGYNNEALRGLPGVVYVERGTLFSAR